MKRDGIIITIIIIISWKPYDVLVSIPAFLFKHGPTTTFFSNNFSNRCSRRFSRISDHETDCCRKIYNTLNKQYFLTKQWKSYFKTPNTSYTAACDYGVFLTRKSSWTCNTQAIWNVITSHALWRKRVIVMNATSRHRTVPLLDLLLSQINLITIPKYIL